jgi:D-lyxose ketol-isomerase
MKHVDKLWGSETWLVNEPEYCAKRMRLLEGAFCSFHRHPRKKETFLVEDGIIRLEYGLDGSYIDLAPGDHFTLAPGTWHRFTGKTGATFLEVSTHHDDKDCERLTSSGAGPQLPPKLPPCQCVDPSETGACLCRSAWTVH